MNTDNFTSEDLLLLVEEEKSKVNERTIRFSDAPWYIPNTPVLIGGAGGIGSWLGVLLARQDLAITIYDFDSVDLTNLGSATF